ncbi:MAG: hypothetical protein KGO48_17145 [Alphaproteobacteria bacterium]|nr:hypothetical protein [Alphaproteobacteria bacterium]
MDQKHVEWLLQAEFCHQMAERAATPDRRVVWLNLAKQWLLLGESRAVPVEAAQINRRVGS